MTDPRLPAMTSDEARAALAAGTLRADIVAFAQYLKVDGFEPAEHHQLMLRSAQAVLDGTETVLTICTPPGSAKSTYASVVVPLFVLARNPQADVLIVAASHTLASKFAGKIRDNMRRPEFIAVAKGNAGLRDDKTASDDFRTEAGGSVRAVGAAGAQVLGFRADLAVIDDGVPSFEVAASETQLTKIADWLTSDVLTRLKPKGKVVAVQQRLAHRDVHGFLTSHFAGTKVGVRELVLRMEAEADDPLGRPIGATLWPEWFAAEGAATVAIAKQSPLRWECLFQQRPMISIGQWVPDDALVIDDRSPPPAEMVVYGCTDLATGTGAGDFTVHAVVGVRRGPHGLQHLHILDIWRQRKPTHEAIEQMLLMAKRYGIRHWLMDKDMMSAALIGGIKERISAGNYGFRVELVANRGQDKETRAAPLRAMLWEGRVHAPLGAHWLAPLQTEFRGFPVVAGAGVDDQIDSIGLLPRFINLAGVGAPELPLEPETRYLHGQAIQVVGGFGTPAVWKSQTMPTEGKRPTLGSFSGPQELAEHQRNFATLASAAAGVYVGPHGVGIDLNAAHPMGATPPRRRI